MYSLKRELVPGTVVWGERKIYYDDPNRKLQGKRSMYLITSVNSDHFYGCPLLVRNNEKNGTLLSKKHYPLKYDSIVMECLYKLSYSDILSPMSFRVSPKTLEHFRRNLYKKIILGHAESPEEYNELFVKQFLEDNVPTTNDIVVYPSEEKVFKFYYIYDDLEDRYKGIKLEQHKDDGVYSYTITDGKLVDLPKSVYFYDFFPNHPVKREDIEESVNKKGFLKKLGSVFSNK